MTHRFPPLLVLTLLAGGTVGPNFERPPAPATTAYHPPAEQRPAAPDDEALVIAGRQLP